MIWNVIFLSILLFAAKLRETEITMVGISCKNSKTLLNINTSIYFEWNADIIIFNSFGSKSRETSASRNSLSNVLGKDAETKMAHTRLELPWHPGDPGEPPEQILVLTATPPPQVTEHASASDHGPQVSQTCSLHEIDCELEPIHSTSASPMQTLNRRVEFAVTWTFGTTCGRCITRSAKSDLTSFHLSSRSRRIECGKLGALRNRSKRLETSQAKKTKLHCEKHPCDASLASKLKDMLNRSIEFYVPHVF